MFKEAYTGAGEHVNSGDLDGLNNEQAIAKAIELLEAKGAGEKKLTISCVTGYLVDSVIGVNQYQSFIGKMEQ